VRLWKSLEIGLLSVALLVLAVGLCLGIWGYYQPKPVFIVTTLDPQSSILDYRFVWASVVMFICALLIEFSKKPFRDE
jgi:hypothetical protein